MYIVFFRANIDSLKHMSFAIYEYPCLRMINKWRRPNRKHIYCTYKWIMTTMNMKPHMKL